MAGPLSNPFMFGVTPEVGDFYTHQIDQSCRLVRTGAAAGGYFRITFSGSPTSTQKGTFSTWIKRSVIGTGASDEQYGIFVAGAGGGAAEHSFVFGEDDVNQLVFSAWDGSTLYKLNTHARYKDVAAWMHVVIAWDTTQGTAANRVKIYVNGVEPDLDTADYPDEDQALAMFSATEHTIGLQSWNDTKPLGGYLAETIGIDGIMYAASDFGEFKNGIWIPKDASGLTFGNNGFFLNYADSAALGDDVSGNSHDFAATVIAAHDQMKDSPTFSEDDANGGNFCTFNPEDKGSYVLLSEGNLRTTGSGPDAGRVVGTMAVSSGKWYWESNIVAMSEWIPSTGVRDLNGGSSTIVIGQGMDESLSYDTAPPTADNLDAIAANITNMGTVTTTMTGVIHSAAGDFLSIALDLDNHKMWFAKNNTWMNSANPATGTNPQFSWTTNDGIMMTPWSGQYGGSNSIFNFGQDGTFAGTQTAQGNADDTGYGNFYYAPPSGFLAICSGNLPVVAAIDPAQTNSNYPQKLFAPKLYTGDGASTLTISGMDLQPDFTWIKNRDATDDHLLFDSTRGVTKWLSTHNTSATETTDTDTLKSWTSDGFTVGADVKTNTDTEKYVSWNWRVNGGTTTANTTGDTASVTQVDPSGSFSIVTYTGFSGSDGDSTVGHGMSIAPQLIIHVSRTRDAGRWTQSITTANASTWMTISGTNAETALSAGTYGSMARPTTSVFSINGIDGVGGESANYVAYCFASVDGFCKVGRYEGNGNAYGAYVYCGFRPAFVMTKSMDSTSAWHMFDDAREGYNTDNDALEADDTTVEQVADMIDILSNGFKCRIATDPNVAETYIYLAVASMPFKYANAR